MSVEYNGKEYKTKMSKLRWTMEKKGKFLSLILKKKKISDIAQIKGLENLTELETLNLSGNNLTKISGLDNLTNLKHLIIEFNDITEISGLENLKNLEFLNLTGNQIKEIKGLSSNRKFKYLDLGYNDIEEIKNVETLVNLNTLSLMKNKIREIKGIEELKLLTTMFLENNYISEIKGIGSLPNLCDFSIKKNPVSFWVEDNFEFTTLGYVKNVNRLVTYSSYIDNTLKEITQVDKEEPKKKSGESINIQNTLVLKWYSEGNSRELITMFFMPHDADLDSEIRKALVNLGNDALAYITVLIRTKFIMTAAGEGLTLDQINPLIKIIGDIRNPKSQKLLIEIQNKIDGNLEILSGGQNDTLKFTKELISQSLRKVSESEISPQKDSLDVPTDKEE